MKKWTDEFLTRCLTGIPQGEYRHQLHRELEDHLLTLEDELRSDGYSEQDARVRAVDLMGSPDVLNRDYQARFTRRQLQSPFYILGRFSALALLTGVYYALTYCALCLAGFTADASFAHRVSYPLYGHPLHQFIFGGIIFLVPFSLNALHLRRTFALHPHTGVMVLAGLLFTWFLEKTGLFILCSALGGNSMLDILLGGWADAAPWLNFPYILFSYLGCFVLAALFSPRRFPGGESA